MRENVKAAVQPQVENNTSLVPLSAKTQVCESCGRELPLDDFPRHRNGHMKVCKECRRRFHPATDSKVNPLEKFTARQLMDELYARGYRGELSYTQVHKIILGR